MSLIPWVITFITSFALGIEYGILIGIGVQLLLLLYPVARPKITFKNYYSDRRDQPGPLNRNIQVDYLDYVVVTFNQAIRFPSVEYLQTRILKHMYTEDEKPRSVILDCNHLASGLDYTTIMGLIEVIADFKKKGVHFSMAGVHPEIKKELDHANVVVLYGDNVADSIRKIKEKEKAGQLDDEIESITVTNGKLQAAAINGTPIPNVPEVNYGYSKGPNDGDSDSDNEEGVRL